MNEDHKKQQIDKLLKELVDVASPKIDEIHQDGMFHVQPYKLMHAIHLYLYVCLWIYRYNNKLFKGMERNYHQNHI